VSPLNLLSPPVDRHCTLASTSTNVVAILNARAASKSMTALHAAALDETVVNARRRFRRVLAAWAVDVLMLAAQDRCRVHWTDDSLRSGD